MNNVKNRKKEIQLDGKEEGTPGDSAASSQKLSEVVSFDAYFSKLVRSNPKIMIHHKAPMRHYAESKGLKDAATEAEFDEAVKQY